MSPADFVKWLEPVLDVSYLPPYWYTITTTSDKVSLNAPPTCPDVSWITY